MKLSLAIAASLLLASVPTLTSAAEVRVDTHRHVVAYDSRDVLVVRRPHSNVVVVHNPDADCVVRTVRTWTHGRYVARRVTYCGS